jgi:zinc transport system ATP-binding protein
LFFKYEQEYVLENISISVEKQDFLTILGPNGGGKSTLIKIILGIEKLQKGFIKIFDKSFLKESLNIGYVPQSTDINLNFPIKVLEVVMMAQNNPKKRYFFYSKDEKKQAVEVLEKVGMSDYANARISSLSGGQRQRVLIARALFGKPKILLLDEPTSNIDVVACEMIYETLKELNKQITIIVISHDLSLVLKYANKAVYLNKTFSYHDLSRMKDKFSSLKSNTSEIELLQMLGECKC